MTNDSMLVTNTTILTTVLMQIASFPPTSSSPILSDVVRQPRPVIPAKGVQDILRSTRPSPPNTTHATTTQYFNQSTHTKSVTMTSSQITTEQLTTSAFHPKEVTEYQYEYDEEGMVPPSFIQEHHTPHSKHHKVHDKLQHLPGRPAGPYFRPPSAISKNYRQMDDDANAPACWPHCLNNHTSSYANRRHRKHSNFKKKFYNYKLLYDTLKVSEGAMRRQETEFYAWIFGATMLTLGSLTTLTSCFAFCFCSEKWRKRRRRTKKFDKSGQYQRVDSVSSMVDSHADPQELMEQMDSVTII